MTSAFAQRARLGACIERVIRPEYGNPRRPGASMPRLSSAWSQAGLATGWISRLGREYSPVFAVPGVTGAGLTEVACGVLALPTGGAGQRNRLAPVSSWP